MLLNKEIIGEEQTEGENKAVFVSALFQLDNADFIYWNIAKEKSRPHDMIGIFFISSWLLII